MVYAETIEESKPWVCPKSGVWKVICIGGGGGGSSYVKANVNYTANGSSGGTTSFGTHLSAAGGEAYDSNVNNNTVGQGSGINGYNGASAYGTPSGITTGTGYGASGGAYFYAAAEANSVRPAPGSPGEVKSCIINIEKDTTIMCTIGAAGKGSVNNAAISYAGRAGAIIVQYLGESM